MQKITIVIPTFNERENISAVIKKIIDLGISNLEIIIVDDNSPDKTWEVARKFAKRYNVKVLRRIGKSGLSSAVVDGFRIAKGDILGVIDADLSHPPETIPKMLDIIKDGKADMVVASRLVEGGSTEGWPARRKLTSKIATILAKPITSVEDSMSGFFLFKKEVIEGVRLKPKGYKIGLEIIVKGKAKKIVEIPILFRDRTAGKSKLGMKQNIEYLSQLYDLYLFKLKKGLFRK